MLVYVANITPRLEYIFHFFSQYYRYPFTVTEDEEAFRSSEEPKLNYSITRFSEKECWIRPHYLLSESFIKPVTVECFKVDGYTAFFGTEGDHPFDIYAASFYLLSRYEEYYDHRKDEYGRYAHQNSIAFREGFLHQPLINIWLEAFRKTLRIVCDLQLPSRQFEYTPTYDIDIAWSYQHKGLQRSLGGLARSVINGDWRSFKERVLVIAGKAADPYDSYQWMDELHREFNLHPFYFIHTGMQRNKYDKNIAVDSKAWQSLVRKLANEKIGLHPSWASNENTSLLDREKERLEKIIGNRISASRQHYIRFQLPATYRRLITAGISDDYSMGYGSINGFRASFAGSYQWYDLEKDTAASLMLHPFCFMDANAFFEQQLDEKQALEEMRALLRSVREVKGSMITIWHNTFLGTDPMFRGWRESYRQFITSVVADQLS